MIEESVANVSSGTLGSEWWDNIGGGACPNSSDDLLIALMLESDTEIVTE